MAEIKKAEVTVEGRRIYVQTHKIPAYVDAAKAVGAKWDPESSRWWVGAVKKTALEAALVAAEAKLVANPDAQQDPSKVRIIASVTYKGRRYYASAYTRDGSRVRLVTLPDAKGKYLDFWADAGLVQVVKRYEPRTTGRGRFAREEYQTLGGMASFIRRQRSGESSRVQCHECDAWHNKDENCPECGGC